MGAPLDWTSCSPFRLRSARTSSTTLLGFEFLQRPQHVLSNLLDRPHSSVLARSTTIASSSAFPLASVSGTNTARQHPVAFENGVSNQGTWA